MPKSIKFKKCSLNNKTAACDYLCFISVFGLHLLARTTLLGPYSTHGISLLTFGLNFAKCHGGFHILDENKSTRITRLWLTGRQLKSLEVKALVH